MICDGHPSRKIQKEERREQILDAAVRLFSAKGFASASIRDIAKGVGITEGLIYHYFESKEQLLYTSWKERFWAVHLERILSSAGSKSVKDVLQEMIGKFIQVLRENKEMVRMCATEMQHNKELARHHLARIEADKKVMRDFLLERSAIGELRSDIDPDIGVTLLMATAYNTFLHYGDAPEDIWDQKVALLLGDGIDVVMNGMQSKSKD